MINRYWFASSRLRLAGFTLLELMVVLAIVGIMVAVAGPSFQSTIQNSNIASARDSLANGVKMARGEALYKKTTAVICASTDQATCSGGSDWEQGWIIFTDVSANGVYDAAEDTLVDVNYGFNGIVVGADGSGGQFAFDANGIRVGAGQWSVSVCDETTA